MFKAIAKKILRAILPTVIDFLQDMFQKWIDDPNTQTDDQAVKAVGDFLEYVALKKLN